jgi:hypothetical protein
VDNHGTMHWSRAGKMGYIAGTYENKPNLIAMQCKFNKGFFYLYCVHGSRDSAVGIATGCRLDGQGVGVQVSVGARFFSSPRHRDRFWDPPSLQSSRYLGVKQPEREADHSPQTSAEVTVHPLPHAPSWRSA